MRYLALFSLCLAAFAQTKATKPFTPPPARLLDPRWVFGGPLMKDEGCAKDFVKSEAMEGLEKRKYIAELITYGCGIQLQGFYVAQALDSRTFTVGATTMVFRRVLLSNMTEYSKVAYGDHADLTTMLNTKTGWIPQSALFRPEAGLLDKRKKTPAPRV